MRDRATDGRRARGRSDSVDVSAPGPDGDEVIVTFLLDAGTTIIAETDAADTSTG